MGHGGMDTQRGGTRTRGIVVKTAAAAVAVAANALAASGNTNLLVNGDFEDEEDRLRGWRWNYEATGNRWHADNHKFVSIATNAGRPHALKLHATASRAENQGTQVDSLPIPYEPGAIYELSMYAKSAGPNARVLIEGYQWKPGVKPYSNPTLDDLRKVYRQGAGKMVYFGSGERQGVFSNPENRWSRGHSVFPGKDLSEAARKHLEKIEFLSVHIVAIGGGAGDLYVDDVVLKRLVPAPDLGTGGRGRR